MTDFTLNKAEKARLSSLIGSEAELPDMLNAREGRVLIQKQLLDGQAGCLVSFTLNIPGPIKVLPLVPEAFMDGLSRIGERLCHQGFPIMKKALILEKTGPEAFFLLSAPAEKVKAALVPVEDETRLGRLFDIDVIRPDGTKVSREEIGIEGRTCLLCGRPARECARSRTHSVEELTKEIAGILNTSFGKDLKHGI